MTTAGIQTFIQSWQAQHVLSTTASNACLEEKEPPNAVVLCINLQNLPLKDTAEWVQHATEDEVKAHKGLRTTLFVTKIIYAGFTFVPPPAGADKSVRGERLAILDGDSELEKRSILFYNYKGEQNKKLDTYVKTKRFDDCTSVSQGVHFSHVKQWALHHQVVDPCVLLGMVITGSIWANKLQNMLKKNKEFDNIGVFELCLVQLGIKSFMSKAADTGMMLEIKSVTPLRTMSLSQHQQMVPHTLPPRSVQESVEFRNKFMDGLFVSEDKRKHLKQELIKGNYSTSTHLVALTPTSEHGIVAISADGKLKFFQRQPIGDIHATTMELSYDLPFHWGGDSAHKQEEDPVEWMAKLFNVAMMMGALELFVVADEYRMRGGGANRGGGNPPQQSVQDAPAPSLDIHLQAYARVNEKQILSRIVALDTPVLLQAVATEEEEICTYIAAQVCVCVCVLLFEGLSCDPTACDGRASTSSISSSSSAVPRLWISSSTCAA
jgi:hypothetical protein